MIAFKENILDRKVKYPWNLSVHLINLFQLQH